MDISEESKRSILIINEEEKGSILILNSVWVCEGCDDDDKDYENDVYQIILHKITNKGVCAFCGIETVGEKTFVWNYDPISRGLKHCLGFAYI